MLTRASAPTKVRQERPSMADEPEVVSVQSLSISPNNCPLEEPLDLAMDFTITRPLPAARWVVKFIADQADKRKIVVLGETPPVDYAAGQHSMSFSVPEVNVSHLKRHVLANVGLLIAGLFSGEDEIVQVSMVTQVTPSPDGALIRSVYSPLE
ncbi:hypothetical protein AB1Y20_002136 [Prymnesium parvum]|uniref:Uncharacterized protein n=1 Tax=Prymnesium parvum TaxID=97485 RepID=A0AB34JAD3_PRYPA